MRAPAEEVAYAQLAHEVVEPGSVGASERHPDRQHDVLANRQDRHEVEGLEDEAHPGAAQAGPAGVAETGDLGGADGHRAAVRGVEARQTVHESGLAAPGRTHDGGPPPLVDGHGHPVQRPDLYPPVGIGLAQVVGPDRNLGGWGHRSPSVGVASAGECKDTSRHTVISVARVNFVTYGACVTGLGPVFPASRTTR